jgi:hypothetical protein
LVDLELRRERATSNEANYKQCAGQEGSHRETITDL